MDTTKKRNVKAVKESKKVKEKATKIPVLDKATLTKKEAADYVRNYLKMARGLSPNGRYDDNTKFLWIEISRLVKIINDWNGSELLIFNPKVTRNFDKIRIYPMIYKKDHPDQNRKNLLNLCLVPLKGDTEYLPKGFVEDNYIKQFGDIQNEIGQCPPYPSGSTLCNDNGTILLNAADALTGPPTSE